MPARSMYHPCDGMICDTKDSNYLRNTKLITEAEFYKYFLASGIARTNKAICCHNCTSWWKKNIDVNTPATTADAWFEKQVLAFTPPMREDV